MNPIVVILLTYQRTAYALQTIRAAIQHLRYDGDLRWYVADDGSDPAHVDAVLSAVTDGGATLIGYQSQRRGYGANANMAWTQASAESPLSFWLEDDWMLTRSFDLTPHAQALDDPEVGMVRLGYLNRGIAGSTVNAGGRLYWRLYHEPIESNELIFTGHPSLRHDRYREAYGDYATNLGPGDTELDYAYRYRVRGGPWIVWSCDYPSWGVFAHIGTTKTENL